MSTWRWEAFISSADRKIGMGRDTQLHLGLDYRSERVTETGYKGSVALVHAQHVKSGVTPR